MHIFKQKNIWLLINVCTYKRHTVRLGLASGLYSWGHMKPLTVGMAFALGPESAGWVRLAATLPEIARTPFFVALIQLSSECCL